MKKHFLIIILFIFLCIQEIFAQHSIGIGLYGGLSRITNTFDIPNGDINTKFVPSGQIGFHYNYLSNNNSLFEANILFSQICGKEESDIYTGSVNLGHTRFKVNKHISYLSLPIFYGYRHINTTVKIGFRSSYMLTSSGVEESSVEYLGDKSYFVIEYDELNIKKFDYGPIISISQLIFNRLVVETRFYYGMANIINVKDIEWAWKIRQLTIGIKYTFKDFNNKPNNN